MSTPSRWKNRLQWALVILSPAIMLALWLGFRALQGDRMPWSYGWERSEPAPATPKNPGGGLLFGTTGEWFFINSPKGGAWRVKRAAISSMTRSTDGTTRLRSNAGEEYWVDLTEDQWRELQETLGAR